LSREFTMGARLTLMDDFTDPMETIRRATEAFSNIASHADNNIVQLGRAADQAAGDIKQFRNNTAQADDTLNQMRNVTQRAADNMRILDSQTDLAGDQIRQLNNQATSAASGIRNFNNAASQANSELSQQHSLVGRVSSGFTGLRGIVAAVAGSMAIKGAFNWLVGANADMEQYQNTLSVVLGSQKEAVKTLEWANKFAAQTPFEIPQIVEATTRLSAYGMKAQDVLGITGDMASVMGKDLMQAVEAVADAQTGELERMKEFGITKKMIEDQAKLMGKNPINNKGQITDIKAFNDAMFSLMEKRFKGGMEMQSKSFKGMLSNASDFMAGIGRRLGAPIFEKAKVGLTDLLGFLDRLQSNGSVDSFIKNVQTGFSKVGSVVSAVVAPFKALYDMMAGSGNMNYFINLFGVEGAAGFNNILWDIVDAVKGVWDFAAGSLFPALKTGFLAAVDGARVLAGWVLSQYFNFQKLQPFVIGVGAALLVYAGYLKMVALQTKIVTIATQVWNAVTKMSPIWLVAAAIGLLVGYLIHLAGGWDVVKQKIIGFLPVLQQLWSGIVTGVMPILKQLWSVALTVFNNFKTTILPIILEVINTIVSVFTSLVGWVRAHWDAISVVIQIAWAAISAYIAAGINTIKIIITGGFHYISEIISGVWKVIKGIVQIGWSIISGLFKTGIALLKGDWQGAWDSMVGMLKGVWSGIKTFFSGLKDLFFDSGKAIMQTLVDGIKSMASAPFKAIKSALGKARELLPFSDAKTGPFSELTHNGGRIMSTLAEGVYNQTGSLHKSMNQAFAGVPSFTPGFDLAPKFDTGSSLMSDVKRQASKMADLAFPKVGSIAPPGLTSQMEVLANMNIPTIPEFSTSLNVATKFDDVNTPSYTASAAGGVNPAGKGKAPETGNRTVTYGDINIKIDGSNTSDPEEIADIVMEKLHDALQNADEVLSSVGMEDLL
jgi:phage-related protein